MGFNLNRYYCYRTLSETILNLIKNTAINPIIIKKTVTVCRINLSIFATPLKLIQRLQIILIFYYFSYEQSISLHRKDERLNHLKNHHQVHPQVH